MENNHEENNLEILLAAAPDKLSLLASCGSDWGADEISSKKLSSFIAKAGYIANLSEEGYAQLVENIKKNQPVDNLVIANGIPPINGQDGTAVIASQDELSTSETLEHSKVDYRKNLVQSANVDDVICRITLPMAGTQGRDVYGDEIPANDGSPATIKYDKTVALSEDGTLLTACIDGMILFSNNELSISPIYQTQSDVDFSTGNIHMKTGSVVVKGNVLRGFSVVANGNIAVMQSIEDCEITAKGDVTVGQGIIMAETGLIKADGKVTARFMRNARIESGSEVIAANSITNCQVKARGKVTVSGSNGRIQGGSVSSSVGVEAQNIGSNANVVTQINIVSDAQPIIELSSEKRAIQLRVSKLEGTLGSGSRKEIIERTASKYLRMVEMRLNTLEELAKKLAIIEKDLIEKQSLLSRMENKGKVTVAGTVHVGTIINFHGHNYQVNRETSAVHFYYDAENNAVAVVPM